MMKQLIVATLLSLFYAMAAQAAIPLTEAIEHIANEYNITVSYCPSLTDSAAVTRKSCGDSADECLLELLRDTDFDYTRIDCTCYYVWPSREKIAARKEYMEKLRRQREERLMAAKPGALIVPQPGVSPSPTAIRVGNRQTKPAGPLFSLKTNALLLAAMSPNIAVETRLGKCVTVEVPVNFSMWTLGDCRLDYVAVFPTVKYWVGGEAFRNDYIGAYVGYARFDIGGIKPLGGTLEDYYYAGDLYSAGLVYGHRFTLSRHFALEAEVGVGYVYTSYTQTPLNRNTPQSHDKHKWSLTRLALNVCYTY